jgi:DNA-binding LacI/PurR family transcriptional regulator
VVKAIMDAHQPDAIVCANDRTAARLMQTLLRLGYGIPNDVRLVGIDDVEYAGLLPVPLTTLRQPTRQIGDVALAAMLDRVARRDLPTRDILLHCELIVRDSCGAAHSRRPIPESRQDNDTPPQLEII